MGDTDHMNCNMENNSYVRCCWCWCQTIMTIFDNSEDVRWWWWFER